MGCRLPTGLRGNQLRIRLLDPNSMTHGEVHDEGDDVEEHLVCVIDAVTGEAVGHEPYLQRQGDHEDVVVGLAVLAAASGEQRSHRGDEAPGEKRDENGRAYDTRLGEHAVVYVVGEVGRPPVRHIESLIPLLEAAEADAREWMLLERDPCSVPQEVSPTHRAELVVAGEESEALERALAEVGELVGDEADASNEQGD